MYRQALSSSVAATPRPLNDVFSWVFAVLSTGAPIQLVLYAFLSSSDPVERAQTIVGGLESTVFVLIATLAMRAFFGFATKEQAAQLVTE